MENIKVMMDKVLSVICAALFSFMVCLAVYQVIARYVFNSPSSFSEELLTFCFAWLAMLAATLVFGERDHMRLGYFADKLAGRKSLLLAIITEIIILIFASLVLVYGGISITKLTMTQVTASLGIPMGYVYSIMPVCGFLILIYCIANIFALSKKMNSKEKEEIS